MVMSRTLTILAVIAIGGAIGAGGAYMLDVGASDGQAVAETKVNAGNKAVSATTPVKKKPRMTCRDARLIEKDIRARWEPLWMQCDRLKTHDEKGYRRCVDVECSETCAVAKERQKKMNAAIRARVRLCTH